MATGQASDYEALLIAVVEGQEGVVGRCRDEMHLAQQRLGAAYAHNQNVDHRVLAEEARRAEAVFEVAKEQFQLALGLRTGQLKPR